MKNALDCFWPLLEFVEPAMAESSQCAWPKGVWEQLIEVGFLCRTVNAESVLCPGCYEHYEEVVALDYPDGGVKLFVPCPELLRAEVDPRLLHQWTGNFDHIVTQLAEALGLSGRPKELVPRRLWRLGRTTWLGRSRDVLFARCLNSDDSAPTRAEIVRGRRPIVFVPMNVPPNRFWNGRQPPVLSLMDFTALKDNQIEIEVLAVASAIHYADETSMLESPLQITAEELQTQIRQEIAGVQKFELTDDIIVSAYRQFPSYRGAADWLTRELGQAVSKDKVSRAILRRGGALAVLNADDSDSICRGVAAPRQAWDDFKKSRKTKEKTT